MIAKVPQGIVSFVILHWYSWATNNSNCFLEESDVNYCKEKMHQCLLQTPRLSVHERQNYNFKSFTRARSISANSGAQLNIDFEPKSNEYNTVANAIFSLQGNTWPLHSNIFIRDWILNFSLATLNHQLWHMKTSIHLNQNCWKCYAQEP